MLRPFLLCYCVQNAHPPPFQITWWTGNSPMSFHNPFRTTTSTTIWSKPPSTEVFNAPIIYHSILLAAFKGISVTFNGDWQQKKDQGGLIFVLATAEASHRSGWRLISSWLTVSCVWTPSSKTNIWIGVCFLCCQRCAATRELPENWGLAAYGCIMWRETRNCLYGRPLGRLKGRMKRRHWVGIYAARLPSQGDNLNVNFKHLV